MADAFALASAAVERREASASRARTRSRAPSSPAHGWCACRRSASLRFRSWLFEMAWQNSGAKPRRENEWTMFIEDYYKFVMGQVSEDCGGNPTSLEL